MKSTKSTKIFVSAYACEPGLGSEIGVGWHWVLEMSKYFDLWVLTRKSNQSTIENWLANNIMPGKVVFIYYDLPPKLRFWKRGLRGVRLYYILWQKLTNSLVKKTMLANNIKIYHLLTYGNALWPVSTYGKKQHYIWGPTGIGDVIPYSFSKHYNLKGRLIELARRLVTITLSCNYGFINRCKHANLILCKTNSTFLSIPQKYRHKAIIFTDVAVDSKFISQGLTSSKAFKAKTYYLAIGRLDAWRGFDLLIEAFAKAHFTNEDIYLEILGKGSDNDRLQRLIDKYNLNSIISLNGQVSMEEYYRKLSLCDVVVNPALKEGAVTVAFDSMAAGKPLICIDTGGYTRYFSNDYASVIPISDRDQVINDLSDSILNLSDRNINKSMGLKAKEKVALYNWEQKGAQIAEAINKSLV